MYYKVIDCNTRENRDSEAVPVPGSLSRSRDMYYNSIQYIVSKYLYYNHLHLLGLTNEYKRIVKHEK